jgi:acetyltransferase-like isoleucine patch superfamily enzyme
MRHLKGIVHRVARAPRWMWSRFVAGYLRTRGVRVGRQCRFYGIPRVHRARGACISLGDGCVIRSASGSNRYSRGLPTVLSAVAPGAVLTLGEHVGMSDSVIVCTKSVSIGAETLLGAETLVTDTDSHPTCPECRSAGRPARTGEVRIGRECFIGTRSTILKGVRLAPGTCVGAGSIVTEGSGERGGVLAGIPARAVRQSSRCTNHQASIGDTGSAHRS